MFKDLTNLALERTPLQAFGFYLAYFALMLLVVLILGIAVGSVTPPSESSFHQGVGMGAVVAGLTCSFLSFMILKRKNLFGSFSSFVFVVAAAGVGLLAGLLGMIIPAYLTTRTPSSNQIGQ